MKHKFYVLLTLLAFFPLYLHSQQINVSGYVYDFLTKEPLPGVTVQIQGTTRGSITNEKGFFTIGGVSEGETLIFSFLGYIRDEYQASAAQSGELTIFLVPDMQMLNEVVVTVQARGQVSALNEQLTSDYISNVISAERLQEIPDATVADALGRIPGVSVRSSAGEGDKIQIRGMEPRFNLVTVNGVRAPSADPNESSVGLAGVSPFMIAGIEVQKSLTPDKDGDVVGGIVDLRLKDADEGFNVNVVLQNNFNSLVNSNINPRTTLQISNRFFNNKFGVIAVGNYENIDRSSERMSASAIVLAEQDPVRLEHESVGFWSSDFNRERFGGSLFLDYRLPAGSIKANTFINGLNNDEFIKQFNKGQGLFNLNRNIESVVTNTISMVNSFQVEHKLFWNSTINAGVSYTLADSKTPVNYALSTSALSPAGFDANSLPPI
jgi:TonB-dependent receptor